MASNEGQFQKEMIDGFRAKGARVTKITDHFKGGTPDLTVTMKGNHAWLELKFQKEAPKKAETRIRPDLSAGQIKFLRDEQKAGGIGVWVLCVKWGVLHWRIYVGSSLDGEGVDQDSWVIERKRGETWDIDTLWDEILDRRP